MTGQVLQALGGLGLFLFGLIVLTEGLRALAGDAVHRVLFRFTKSPTSGALTGAAVTAVLQSSSVTTVTTVGFVSAGLLSFPQALGVVFGANIGTTATGWMVALLGFELPIEQLVYPLLFVGAMLRLFGRGRVASAGWALAGFAVLFLGLAAMQAGMASFQGVVTPADFPGDTFLGRLGLVGIGIVVTLVTQSSSAGMATALTALDAGAVALPQAAAMVIGMDVGTTSTTAFATLGGSPQTRRTGYSHVVYNLLTGCAAFALLKPYLAGVEALFPGAAPTLVLVGFHTCFNGLGVLVGLPFTAAFARLMTRLVPEDGPDLVARLDAKLLRDPTAAAVSLSAAVTDMTVEQFSLLADALAPAHAPRVDRDRLARVDAAVDAARRYADGISPPAGRSEGQRFLLTSMHAIDHLDRLIERCRTGKPLDTLRVDERLTHLAGEVRHALQAAVRHLRSTEAAEATQPQGAPALGEPRLLEVRDLLRAERRPFRARVLASVPAGELRLDDAIQRLDAIRWLHRVTYHAWRIVHNLETARHPEAHPPASTPLPARAEIAAEVDV